MSIQEIVFLVVSLGLMVALTLAIYKLGNSVPAWVLDVARAGADVGADWADDTANSVDDAIWGEIIEKLDELQGEVNNLKTEKENNATGLKD
jgi:hypothetical protein